MNVASRTRRGSLVALLLAGLTTAAAAQDAAQPRVARLVVEPSPISVQAGQTVPVKLTGYDAQGNVIQSLSGIRWSAPRNGVRIGPYGVKGIAAGSYQMVVSSVPPDTLTEPVRVTVPVTVTWPAIKSIKMSSDSGRLYTGVTLAHRAVALHADSSVRPASAVTMRWKSSNEAIASVDRYGNVTGNRPGTVVISAEADGAKAEKRYTVAANPVASLSIDLAENTVKTGDVIHLKATARRANGGIVADVPVSWSYIYTPDDTIAAPGATGVIDRGLFAAEVPGRYTLLATAGQVTARKVVAAETRDARRRITVQGRGSITHVHTSDFWPWTGKDGRDYALVFLHVHL